MKKLITTLLLTVSCTISPVFAAPQESMEVKTLEDFKQEAIEQVISVALNEEGYLEKSSGNSLYDKTANAGSANYTKYAYDLSSVGFYAGNMNGLPWCDMFVDWCYMQAFGASNAKIITNQNPYGSAACSSSLGFYKAGNQFTKQPQAGDQIFFGNHTGLVYKVDSSTVYTIEGNTNSSSEVVANGGAVRCKSYPLSSSRIQGYGRPNYDFIATQKLEQYNEEIKKQTKAKTKTNEIFMTNNFELVDDMDENQYGYSYLTNIFSLHNTTTSRQGKGNNINS